jgi:hypothetical protein
LEARGSLYNAFRGSRYRIVTAKDYLTGGARIGFFNATWPFAKLRANNGQVTLNVMFSGEYLFPENSVVEIRRYCDIPFFGWGVRIHHTISDYPQKIVFWYLGYPETVLAFLSASGFNPEKLKSR